MLALITRLPFASTRHFAVLRGERASAVVYRCAETPLDQLRRPAALLLLAGAFVCQLAEATRSRVRGAVEVHAAG